MTAVTTGTPEHIRAALAVYAVVVGELIGEDLTTFDDARVGVLNKDHTYPYRFSFFLHEAVEERHVLVDVKEPWFHVYIQAMEEGAALKTPEEKEARQQQLFRDLARRLERPEAPPTD